MDNLFADKETSKMLKSLGYDGRCIHAYYGEKIQYAKKSFDDYESDYHYWGNEQTKDVWCIAPLWQQIKQWLWEKHKLSINTMFIEHGGKDIKLMPKTIYKIDDEGGESMVGSIEGINPITAEIEGIKMAIKYLSDTAVAVTPINTSANGA